MVADRSPFVDDGPLVELGLDTGAPLLPRLAAVPAQLAQFQLVLTKP